MVSTTAIFAQSGTTAADVVLEPLQTGAPVCRLGVNVNQKYGEPPIDGFDTMPLRLGWYIDYLAQANPARPQGMNYAPMIRLHQTGPDSYRTTPSGQTLEDTILANAGQKTTWFIGNEPDRTQWQDDIMPGVYAKAFHELRAQIKAIDPTAVVIAGSIVQATELRMQYLDMILASHQAQYGEPMAVDGWAVHGFILREASCEVYSVYECWGAEIPPGVDATEGLWINAQQNDDFDIFKANIVRMRQWMANNGYRNIPLYLSEYGVLFGDEPYFSPRYSPERVNVFMTRSFDYLLNEAVDDELGYPQDGNRLVQHLSWYSTSDSTDFNGYLYDLSNSGQLSVMGQNYATEAAKINDDLDFSPRALEAVPQMLIVSRGETRQALVVVNVKVANAGNNHYPAAVPVQIFDGDPTAGGQAIGKGVARVAGCGQETTVQIIVRVPWDGVSLDDLPQSLAVFAQVNPDNTVVEAGAGASNNTISTVLPLADFPKVNISLDVINFLPVIQR